jgi:DNA-binding transcriptional MerR regulator
MTERTYKLSDAHLHPHLQKRMKQRGVTLAELEQVLNEGNDALTAKPGTYGKVLRMSYESEWEGQYYEEKEVTVYYKLADNKDLILLTVIARYGRAF